MKILFLGKKEEDNREASKETGQPKERRNSTKGRCNQWKSMDVCDDLG